MPGYQDGTGGRDGSTEFSYLGGLAVNRAGTAIYVSDAAYLRVICRP
jgi:hypothetical protein